RFWLMAAAATPFAGLAGYEWLSQPRISLSGRQRIAFNEFRPTDVGAASLLRDLMITAVRQSLVVSVVPDEPIPPLLRKASFSYSLPAENSQLMTVAGQDGIALVIEGSVRAAQTGIHLALEVFRSGERKPALTLNSRAADRNGIVALAQDVVLQ